MVKMITVDLDGTLLRDDKTVSERNQLALLRCRELGIKVVFATGRAYRTKIVPSNWFDGYVKSNGAYAYADGVEVYQSTISDEIIQNILKVCNRRHIDAEVRGNAGFILHDLTHIDAEYINSILPPNLYLVVLRDNFGQIMHRNATKSKAVEALTHHYNISPTEVIAFGDDLNDIELLSWAGIGVAMGNAVDTVKAIANEICLSNEDDGVAVWIEENMFLN